MTRTGFRGKERRDHRIARSLLLRMRPASEQKCQRAISPPPPPAWPPFVARSLVADRQNTCPPTPTCVRRTLTLARPPALLGVRGGDCGRGGG